MEHQGSFGGRQGPYVEHLPMYGRGQGSGVRGGHAPAMQILEGGQPFVPQRVVSGRGRHKGTSTRPKLSNFYPTEDSQLVKSWLEVSCDPVTNTGQKKERLWDRVHNQYNQKRGSYPERSVRSLQSRWEVIKAEVSKFSGYMAEVHRVNASGTSDADKTCQAAANFASIEKTTFSFMHYWDLMKDEPKWMDVTQRCTRTVDEAIAEHIPQESNTVDQRGEESGGTPTAPNRPPGRDATKAARKRGASSSSSTAEFVTEWKREAEKRTSSREKLFTIEERRLVLDERRIALEEQIALKQLEKEERQRLKEEKEEDERILAINLETCNPSQRLYFQTLQEDIGKARYPPCSTLRRMGSRCSVVLHHFFPGNKKKMRGRTGQFVLCSTSPCFLVDRKHRILHVTVLILAGQKP